MVFHDFIVEYRVYELGQEEMKLDRDHKELELSRPKKREARRKALVVITIPVPLSNWRQSRGLFCPVLCSSGCLGNEEMKCLLTEQSQ